LNAGDILECRVDKEKGEYSFWRDNVLLLGGCIIPNGHFVFAVMLYIIDQSVELKGVTKS